MAPRTRTPASAPPAEPGKLRIEPRPEQTLRIEHLPLGALTPWAKNARTHSKKQIGQIAGSIQAFGFTNPVLVDGTGTILAGHGRVEAARLLGITAVPCVRLEHMSPAQKHAYVLADNKLALNAGWDEELLGEELAALMGLDDLDFDLGVTGFTISEVDDLVEGLSVEEPGDPADDVVPDIAPRRVRLGDVWQLGPHRLVCGDALDSEVVALLMSGPGGQDREQARMVFTDPPYNVPIEGHVLTKAKGADAPKHREFAMASGEMSRAEFTTFLTTAFRNMADHAVDGSIHFLCMDWRHMGEMLEAGEAVYSELKNLVVWAKGQGGMGSFYRSRHELIFAFKKGTAPHVNSFELGQHGRYRTNVWEYQVASTARQGSPDDRSLHPTVKPVQMIADAIKDVSARGEIVLDLFGGSGSTLIAAQKTGRRGYLVEIDPVYCDRILARWEAYAHDEAELVERRASEAADGEPVPPTADAARAPTAKDEKGEATGPSASIPEPSPRSSKTPRRSALAAPVTAAKPVVSSRLLDAVGEGDAISFAEDQEARKSSFWKSQTVISEQPFSVLLECPDPEPDAEPEPVGYGRPPKQYRFKPGQSGNPKGRHRGSKNKSKEIETLGPRLKALIRAEADRIITVRENGGPVTMTMLEAILRRVGYDAGRGQARAQRLFMDLVAKTDADDERLRQEHFEGALNWKRVAEVEIAHRKARGETDVSDIVPHPDDIILYHRAGIAELVGPFSAEEKAGWKQMLEVRGALQSFIAKNTGKLKRQRSPERLAETSTSIQMLGEMLAKLEATMPDWVERD